MLITRPLSAEDKKILASKSQPKDEDIRRAEDELFLNILLRLNALEEDKTVRVEELGTVRDGKINLRHIPKRASIVIAGFTETAAAVVPPNHFRCDYEDANRILYFNAAHNDQTLSVSYVAIGTVLTAEIWNEMEEDKNVHSVPV